MGGLVELGMVVLDDSDSGDGSVGGCNDVKVS